MSRIRVHANGHTSGIRAHVSNDSPCRRNRRLHDRKMLKISYCVVRICSREKYEDDLS